MPQQNAQNSPKKADSKRLSFIVEQEARRALTEEQLKPNPQLMAAGWERRYIADARQAQEASELYTELGFEVHTEPVRAEELGDDCEDCRLLVLLQFQTIYTRRKRD
jgi:hypothetical protein